MSGSTEDPAEISVSRDSGEIAPLRFKLIVALAKILRNPEATSTLIFTSLDRVSRLFLQLHEYLSNRGSEFTCRKII